MRTVTGVKMKRNIDGIHGGMLVILFTFLFILPGRYIYAEAGQIKEREVIIAVIDTGIDYTHDKLKDFIWTNQGEIPSDGIDNDGNGYVDDSNGWNFSADDNIIYNASNSYDDHGTHCAGIIAGNVPANKVKIMPIKILNGPNRTGTVKSLKQAIEYAEKMGADICNISLGTTIYNAGLKELMMRSDLLFIVAAGNGKNGGDNDLVPVYPASFKANNIISVANVTDANSLNTTSNYGENSVDLAAPGTEVYSTITHNKYGYMSGTSMSAALVSAIAGTVSAENPDVTIEQVKEHIFDMVKEYPELRGKVKTGGGIDIRKQ